MKITVKDYIAAIRKNGYTQTFGALVHYNPYSSKSAVSSACALGQASANLFGEERIGSGTLHLEKGATELNRKLNKRRQLNITQKTINYNDRWRWPLDKIADKLEDQYKEQLDEILYEGN